MQLLEKLVNDRSDGGCYCDDDELKAIRAAMELEAKEAARLASTRTPERAALVLQVFRAFDIDQDGALNEQDSAPSPPPRDGSSSSSKPPAWRGCHGLRRGGSADAYSTPRSAFAWVLMMSVVTPVGALVADSSGTVDASASPFGAPRRAGCTEQEGCLPPVAGSRQACPRPVSAARRLFARPRCVLGSDRRPPQDGWASREVRIPLTREPFVSGDSSRLRPVIVSSLPGLALAVQPCRHIWRTWTNERNADQDKYAEHGKGARQEQPRGRETRGDDTARRVAKERP